MKPATISQIKKELEKLDQAQSTALILRLSKFKRDNKELLTYLLFEQEDERAYIQLIKEEIDELLEDMNKDSYYYMKKTIRKILRHIKKHIRYSQLKSTEAELLLYFCQELKRIEPSIFDSTILSNIYHRQKELAIKAIHTLHEDLRLDFEQEIKTLES